MKRKQVKRKKGSKQRDKKKDVRKKERKREIKRKRDRKKERCCCDYYSILLMLVEDGTSVEDFLQLQVTR